MLHDQQSLQPFRRSREGPNDVLPGLPPDSPPYGDGVLCAKANPQRSAVARVEDVAA